MEEPWENFLSNEMEDIGNSLNLNHEDLFLEEILQQFAFSSESGSPNNLHINNNSRLKLVTNIDEFEPAPATQNDGQAGGGRKKTKNSSKCFDHAVGERKRRLELTKGFIALSALIPGLKKIDKASILNEATTYVKQLLNQVKEMEEQSTEKMILIESVSVLNDFGFHRDRGIVPNIMNSGDHDKHSVALPEVEARVLEKEVLIRIHCDGNQDILLKTLSHITSLDLSIVSHTVLPFGKISLDITIIAQMGDNYKITLKDLVRSLRRAIFQVTHGMQ